MKTSSVTQRLLAFMESQILQINHPIMGWKLPSPQEGERNHPMRAMEATPIGGMRDPLMRTQLPTLAVTPSLEPVGSNRRKPKLAINPTKVWSDRPQWSDRAHKCRLMHASCYHSCFCPFPV